MSYSEVVLDHFFNPRHCSRMEDPDVVGRAGEPGNGPFMLVYLKVDGQRIKAASFQTYGCGPAIAAGSVVTEKIQEALLDDAKGLTEPVINDALGGLPHSKRHCSALAATALADALGAIGRRRTPLA